MRFSNEMKAGLVVVMAILVGVFFFAKTASFKKPTYALKTTFTYAGDLKPDAVVKLSGLEVGRVTSLKFVYDDNTKVECFMELDATGKVREDSIAYIATSGIVGDAYIGITPGKAAFAKHNAIIASEDPIQMRELFKKADEIASNLDTILADVKDVVGENKQNISNIVVNLEGTTKNFEEFSADIKKHPWKLLFKGD